MAKLEELDVDEDDWASELGSKIARIEREETIIVVLGEKSKKESAKTKALLMANEKFRLKLHLRSEMRFRCWYSCHSRKTILSQFRIRVKSLLRDVFGETNCFDEIWERSRIRTELTEHLAALWFLRSVASPISAVSM